MTFEFIIYKPGDIVPKSGQARIVSKNGSILNEERTVVKGEPFPPTPKGKGGYTYLEYKVIKKQKCFFCDEVYIPKNNNKCPNCGGCDNG